MRISIHGTDNGSSFLIALILIFILSTMIIFLIPYVLSFQNFVNDYKVQVKYSIEQNNMEIMNLYDIY